MRTKGGRLTPDQRALRRVAALLDEANLRFTLDTENDMIFLAFRAEHFVCQDGATTIRMFISCRDDGELLLVESPSVYRISEARSPRAARKALLYANFALKSVRYCIDPSDDDEVRVKLELWQTGIEPTAAYLRANLDRLACHIDESDRLLRPVWLGGRRELRRLVERRMRPIGGTDARGGSACGASAGGGSAD